MVVRLVTGLSGSGKSFVCNVLAPYTHRIKFDRLRGGDREAKIRFALDQARAQTKPVLGDITKLVSTVIRRNSDVEFKLYFIDEPLDVVRDRLVKRKGHFNQLAAEKRLARLRRVAAQFGAFTGTAEEVTMRLKHELRVEASIVSTHTFYVYAVVVIEPDGSKLPIYVGKGHRNLKNGYDRVDHYDCLYEGRNKRVFDRISQIGKPHAVEILVDGLDEYAAFVEERRLIREYRERGYDLCNVTDGGVSGWTLSVETRHKMSLARRGKKLGPASEEARCKMSLAKKGRALSPEHRAKIAAAARRQWAARASQFESHLT